MPEQACLGGEAFLKKTFREPVYSVEETREGRFLGGFSNLSARLYTYTLLETQLAHILGLFYIALARGSGLPRGPKQNVNLLPLPQHLHNFNKNQQPTTVYVETLFRHALGGNVKRPALGGHGPP